MLTLRCSGLGFPSCIAAARTVLELNSLFPPLWQWVLTGQSDLPGFVHRAENVWVMMLEPWGLPHGRSSCAQGGQTLSGRGWRARVAFPALPALPI